MNNETDLAQVYGRAAPYSDYGPGDHITYLAGDTTRAICTGTIFWCAAPGQVGRYTLPVRYFVDSDTASQNGGWFDLVLASDIIEVLR